MINVLKEYKYSTLFDLEGRRYTDDICRGLPIISDDKTEMITEVIYLLMNKDHNQVFILIMEKMIIMRDLISESLAGKGDSLFSVVVFLSIVLEKNSNAFLLIYTDDFLVKLLEILPVCDEEPIFAAISWFLSMLIRCFPDVYSYFNDYNIVRVLIDLCNGDKISNIVPLLCSVLSFANGGHEYHTEIINLLKDNYVHFFLLEQKAHIELIFGCLEAYINRFGSNLLENCIESMMDFCQYVSPTSMCLMEKLISSTRTDLISTFDHINAIHVIEECSDTIYVAFMSMLKLKIDYEKSVIPDFNLELLLSLLTERIINGTYSTKASSIEILSLLIENCENLEMFMNDILIDSLVEYTDSETDLSTKSHCGIAITCLFMKSFNYPSINLKLGSVVLREY